MIRFEFYHADTDNINERRPADLQLFYLKNFKNLI